MKNSKKLKIRIFSGYFPDYPDFFYLNEFSKTVETKNDQLDEMNHFKKIIREIRKKIRKKSGNYPGKIRIFIFLEYALGCPLFTV